MWFREKDIKKHKQIGLKDLKGYVLPHAGTEHTGDIISHTLRFKPTKKIDKIVIIYCPSQKKPNVGEYYHEYYVPMMCLKMFFKSAEIIGINILKEDPLPKLTKDFIVISADFSHFLEQTKAINLENKSAYSLMFRDLSDTVYNRVIDDKRSFEYLYQNIPKSYNLQWVGRSRSSGIKGVGYLSFLIRDSSEYKRSPSIVVYNFYDKNMNLLDVKHDPSPKKVPPKIKGKIKDKPKGTYGIIIHHLYRDKRKDFIRGWNTLKLGKNLLTPEIFLENTYENGQWIRSSDKEWPNQKGPNQKGPNQKGPTKKGPTKKGPTKFSLKETIKRDRILYDLGKKKKKTLKKTLHKQYFSGETYYLTF